jgi:hypothetical protein
MNSLDNFVKFIPSANNPSVSITSSPVLTDIESKARRFTNCLTDSLYELSNEPSLGLYRIQVLKLKFRINKSFIVKRKFNYLFLGACSEKYTCID